MNKVVLMGRLTTDPEVRYSQGENATAVARFTLAVNRRYKQNGNQEADFLRCVAFGKNGEFVEKYFRKGLKVCISGRLQTGSYTNQEGQKIYTTDVVIEECDFAESKASGERQPNVDENGFMNIPDGIDEELPFN